MHELKTNTARQLFVFNSCIRGKKKCIGSNPNLFRKCGLKLLNFFIGFRQNSSFRFDFFS